MDSGEEHVFTCGVLTISDSGARGERQDGSGELLKRMLSDSGYELAVYDLVPDDLDKISSTLLDWVDRRRVDLIVTTGGTGVAPTDLTPEATRAVIEKEVPGLGEAMRMASLQKTPHAVLSRAVAGIRKKSLIINLPGSEKAARENLASVLAALPHALDKIRGGTEKCGG